MHVVKVFRYSFEANQDGNYIQNFFPSPFNVAEGALMLQLRGVTDLMKES